MTPPAARLFDLAVLAAAGALFFFSVIVGACAIHTGVAFAAGFIAGVSFLAAAMHAAYCASRDRPD